MFNFPGVEGFPCGSAGKQSACNAEDLGSIPGLGRAPGEGKGYPLQYFGPENSVDCIVHGVTNSQSWLSDFHFHFLSPVLKGYWKWRFPSAYQLQVMRKRQPAMLLLPLVHDMFIEQLLCANKLSCLLGTDMRRCKPCSGGAHSPMERQGLESHNSES